MAQVQITDVVVPAEFTAYQVENSMVSTALFQSGVVLPNGEMQAQFQAGAQQFTVRSGRTFPTSKPTSPATIQPFSAPRRKSPLHRMPTPHSANAKCAKPPNCGKLVKLSAHGTKVLSLIPHHFHPYTLKDIWRVLVLDLVS